MSNQARELATNSINTYVEFFRRFRKADGKYPRPEEIIKRDYGPDDEFEKTFLTLKIEVQPKDGDEKEKIIGFQKKLDLVKQDLVEVVTKMVKAIDQIPRADGQIANSDKTHLWEIRQDDEIVVNAKTEISQILVENLQIAQQAVRVYDEYLFILQEPEKVAEFTSQPNRNQQAYIERIQVYLDTIKKIKQEAPYEIRMSMFLIQCHELNNRLIHECEKLIEGIIKRIYEVNMDEANYVIGEVKQITEKFSIGAKESADLVLFEAELTEVKEVRRHEIHKKYTDLVEWVQLMYQFPQFEVNEEIQKIVKTAFNSVQRIAGHIEERSTNLLENRGAITTRTQNESKDFENELKDLSASIAEFKNKISTKNISDHNNQIKAIKDKLNAMRQQREEIKKKQMDLEFSVIQEFPELEVCEKNIKPYEEFWRTYAEVEKNLDFWEKTPVNELDAEEIQSTFKKLNSTMSRLEIQFQQMKNKLERLAKNKKDTLMKFNKKIPVIRALTTKGLKENHIAKMSKKIGLGDKVNCTEQPLQNMENAQEHI